MIRLCEFFKSSPKTLGKDSNLKYICVLLLLGKYAFIESSSPRRAGDKAMLTIYGSGEDRCLLFAYHMSGKDIDSLSVYKQELGKGILPALLWNSNGNQGDDWKKAKIGIKGGSQYKVRCKLQISPSLI